MKAEELFLAIGEVESSRLTRSELTATRPSGQREQEEPKMKKKNISRTLRNLLVAAVIVSMLAVTAYAVAGFVIFDSPEDMVASLFGDKTGFDHKDVTHFEDPEKPGSVYDVPAYDRVPVDESAAAEAASLVSPVGQSISWEGYTLTVDANMYDPATKCGVLTYTLENPDGLAHYEVEPDGKFFFPDGEIVTMNQYGRSYIIQDKTTDTKLTAAYYYQLRNPNTTDMELTLSDWIVRNGAEYQQKLEELRARIRQEYTEEDAIAYKKKSVGDMWHWFEENYTREKLLESCYSELETAMEPEIDMQTECPYSITIPEEAQGEMSSIALADGSIHISSIAICVDGGSIPGYPSEEINVTKIRFKDGTEYVVRDDNTANYVFAVGSTPNNITFMFNRMIDVNEISSVTVDGGLEFSVQ